MKIRLSVIFFSLSFLFSVKFSVLTYNIHALSPIFAGDKPKKRIVDILNGSRDYDVILFQENWIFSESDLSVGLGNHQIYISSKSKFSDLVKHLINSNGSGLTLVAKEGLSILDVSEISFDNCSGWISKSNDCLATKGFQHTSVQIEGERLDLYNTHLDAGGSEDDRDVRSTQIKSLVDYIKEHSVDCALIVAGDLNINLLDEDGRELIVGLTEDLNMSNVDWYSDSFGYPWALDYILFRGSRSLELSLVRGGVDLTLLGLSDHPPLKAVFDVKKRLE